MMKNSTEQTSSVRQCSRLILVGVLGRFFQNLAVINYFHFHHPLLYTNYAFHKFLNLVCFTGLRRNIKLSMISITVKANSVFPDVIYQG